MTTYFRKAWALARVAGFLVVRLAYRVVTMQRRGLPTFFVLGPPRSGTTSLSHYLTQHPSYRSPLMKELGYNPELRPPQGEIEGWLYHRCPPWIRRPVQDVVQRLYYEGGEEGYRKLFPLYRDMEAARLETGAAITGDFTVHGLYNPDMVRGFPYRMSGEQARYLTILRDPVDFLFSFYTIEQSRMFRPVNRSMDFEEFLRYPEDFYTDPEAILSLRQRLLCWRPLFEEREWFDPETFNFATAMVCYSVFVGAWNRALGDDRLLVLHFADLRDRTQATMDRVFEFLAVPPHEVADVAAQNPAAYAGRSVPEEAERYLRSIVRPYDEELRGLLGQNPGW